MENASGFPTKLRFSNCITSAGLVMSVVQRVAQKVTADAIVVQKLVKATSRPSGR